MEDDGDNNCTYNKLVLFQEVFQLIEGGVRCNEDIRAGRYAFVG